MIDRIWKVPLSPDCYNGSIFRAEDVWGLVYRRRIKLGDNRIGVCRLDENFVPTKIVPDIRLPARGLDPRVLSCGCRQWVFFSDNRNMYMAILDGTKVFPDHALKLYSDYDGLAPEKNWSPWLKGGQLYFSRMVSPHIVVRADLSTGRCRPAEWTESDWTGWEWGEPRGGTPAILTKRGYLGFFHSYAVLEKSEKEERRQYFMGAYLFDPEPPYRVKARSAMPLFHSDFYTTKYTHNTNPAVYPCGLHVEHDKGWLSYGENDGAVKVALLNLPAVFRSLVEMKPCNAISRSRAAIKS